MSSAAHPILDAVLAGSLIVHTHIGFDACIVDYLHTRKFPVLGAVANWGLRAATLAALWGAYEFNTNDVGACGRRSKASLACTACTSLTPCLPLRLPQA